MLRRIVPTLFAVGITVGLGSFALAQETTLEVIEIQMGSALERGIPTSPSTSFSRASGGSLYCMVRFRNHTGAEGHIRIAFERVGEGEPAARASGQRLAFPASRRYRTVARGTPNRAPGAYRCVIRTDEGAVLSHHDFQITE